jgi:hypothetical protein
MTVRFITGATFAVCLSAASACWPWSHKYSNLAPLPAGTVICANSAQLHDRAPFVVDLRLHSANATPNLSDFIKIEDAGGHVLHAFNVPVVRARIDGDGLASLLTSKPPFADAAFVVTDTSTTAPAASALQTPVPCSAG